MCMYVVIDETRTDDDQILSYRLLKAFDDPNHAISFVRNEAEKVMHDLCNHSLRVDPNYTGLRTRLIGRSLEINYYIEKVEKA